MGRQLPQRTPGEAPEPSDDLEVWPLSEWVRPEQLHEWCEHDDNTHVNNSPLADRRRWLRDKADAKGFFHYDGYLRRLDIPVGGQVLEIGAGTFWLSSYLSTFDAVKAVVGVELSRERPIAFRDLTAELFGARREKITYAIGDMHRIARPDKTFDLVVCDATLHHADNLITVLREAWRVLKPGGWFVAFREPSISRWRLRDPVFDHQTPENGSAMYYYIDGWRSAFVNGWYSDIRITRFYENLQVRGIHLAKRTQRLARPLLAPLWAVSYPKIVIGGRRP